MKTYKRGDLTVYSQTGSRDVMLTYRAPYTICMFDDGDSVVALEAHWNAVEEVLKSGAERIRIYCGITVTREVKTFLEFDWNGLSASGIHVEIMVAPRVIDNVADTVKPTNAPPIERMLTWVDNAERAIFRIAVAGLSLFTIWAIFVHKASGR